MDRVFLPRLLSAGFELDLGGLARGLLLFGTVARERRALKSLDARLLRDVGIDPERAAAEAARPFWDAPSDR